MYVRAGPDNGIRQTLPDLFGHQGIIVHIHTMRFEAKTTQSLSSHSSDLASQNGEYTNWSMKDTSLSSTSRLQIFHVADQIEGCSTRIPGRHYILSSVI